MIQRAIKDARTEQGKRKILKVLVADVLGIEIVDGLIITTPRYEEREFDMSPVLDYIQINARGCDYYSVCVFSYG